MNPNNRTEGDLAAERIRQARANRDAGGTRDGSTIAAPILPSVSASDLISPTTRVTPPAPQLNTNDGSRTNALVAATASNTENFITAQSDEARKQRELAGLLGDQTFTGAAERERLNQEMGLPTNLARLTDIQTQLAERNTQSELNKARAVSGGAGAVQAERALTLEDRQAAIRNAGLAAEANILQGNIQTASTLINQAMSDYYSDRQLRNQNLITQLEFYSGIVDDQTQQLLDREKRAYEEDQARVQRVIQNVDAAISTGAATPEEIQKLTNPNVSDNERLALSQLIQAKGARQERDVNMAIKAEQLAKLREPVVATRETSVVDVGGNKQLVDTQTGEIIATFGPETSVDEIKQARDVHFVNTLVGLTTHPGMSKSVGTTRLGRWTPFTADVFTGDVSDFTGSVNNIVKKLTLTTFEEARARGVTFGAADKSEWDMLGQSATKIAQWTRERDDGSVYYDTSENNMKRELDLIANFAKMDALRKGTQPSEIGVLQMDDGTFWTQDSFGNYVQLNVNPQ